MKKHILFLIIGIILISLSFISAVSIKKVSSFPQEAASGEIVDIEIEIENILSEDISNIRVKLDLENIPFAPYQSSSEKVLNELEQDEKEDFKFRLIVLPSTASGIYKIPVKISYENDSGAKTKEEMISIIVNSEPEIKIALDDSTALIRGKENILPIKIINSGFSDVRFFYITANNANGIKFISENEQYIGDVDSDSFDNVEYKVYLSDNAGSLISIPVILKFKDSTNKEFIKSQNIAVTTYSTEDAIKFGLIPRPNYSIYIGIGISVIGFIIYRIRKKRKLKKKI